MDDHIDKLLDACFGLTSWKTSIDIHIDKLLEMLFPCKLPGHINQIFVKIMSLPARDLRYIIILSLLTSKIKWNLSML